jgi:hypothetical protein
MMMFFNKKTEKTMNDWYEKYPIGKRLNYCGRKLIIRKNWTVFAGSGIEPYIIANYLDNHGCIQSIEFSETQAEKLFRRK